MKRSKMFGVTAVFLFLLLVAGLVGFAAEKGDPKAGKVEYNIHCAVCHGTSGKGDGSVEFALFPKPRDLTSGKFKIRSTPTLPTDQDLFRVISRGIPGTGMPSWASLSEAERWDLVAFVKTLSPVFQQAGPAVPSALPKATPQTPELLSLGKFFSLGKQLYQDAGCIECHGATGRGDGPKADSLKDEWGYRIIPYDFTSGRMKRGNAVEDVYQTLMNGMGGTPMPSYADSLSEEETWALAFYAWSLAR